MTTEGRILRSASLAIAFCLLQTAAASVLGQTNGTCVPVIERAGRAFGCFITARELLSELPQGPLYWHLDSYPSVQAAEAAKEPGGAVVESFGKVWLFSLAKAEWRARGGHHVAEIGPLPVTPADKYAAVYMEGVFKPGMASEVHRHPGTEAWFTLEGEMCVETPAGKQTQGANGPSVIVPAGLPMELLGTGTVVRRSLVLILQDESKPRSSHASDWTPKGLCRS